MRHTSKFIFLFSFAASSCTTNTQKEDFKADTTTSSNTTLPDIAKYQTPIETAQLYSDTVVINRKSAIIFYPDSMRMEERAKIDGLGFLTGTDMFNDYKKSAIQYLEAQGLPVIDAGAKRYLKFTQNNKKVTLVKLDTLPELWGLYLFDPKNLPSSANMANIEDEYKKYFLSR